MKLNDHSIIGIDIGGTKIGIVKSNAPAPDQRPEFLREIRFQTTTVVETLERILQSITEMAPGDSPRFGIVCGDPMDTARGIIQSPPNLPGWDNIHITKLLTDRFGGEAYLMNDANAGAVAEWLYGAARGCRNVAFLTHGTGMGAGLIINGCLYEGACGLAGEIGHIRMTNDGPVGYGKPGSFEGWTSGAGIARLAKCMSDEGSVHIPNHYDLTKITTKDIADAARAGNDWAVRILTESGKLLGRGLAILIDILNPEIIVLGSLYSRMAAFLEPAMRSAIQEEALPRSAAACRIVAAELGDAIGYYAALSVALMDR
ncbi:MAG: ROK family protein [Planctomycetota bacterium]